MIARAARMITRRMRHKNFHCKIQGKNLNETYKLYFFPNRLVRPSVCILNGSHLVLRPQKQNKTKQKKKGEKKEEK